MGQGATAVVTRLYQEGRLDGLLAIGGGTGSSIAFVVLTGPDFRADPTAASYYRQLTARLHADHAHVADLQDYAVQPQLRDALTRMPLSARRGRWTRMPSKEMLT